MNEELQELLYPLGFLASFFFFSRFFFQWLLSEKMGRVVVPKSFWTLSLAGHVLLFSHAVIQQQFHVACVQSISAVISWRNINLMKKHPVHISWVYLLLVLAPCLPFALFSLEHLFNADSAKLWFRMPFRSVALYKEISDTLIYHLFGWASLMLLSSRFFVQWWISEQKTQSVLPKSFWWISLSGNSLSFFYFATIFDPVHFLGPLFNLAVSIRNLQLSHLKNKDLSNA